MSFHDNASLCALHLRRLVALAVCRPELPGWGHIYAHMVGQGPTADQYWARFGVQEVIGKWHGNRLLLDLSNWSDRKSYFLARYYELDTQLVLRSFLRPGDTMVDIGANIGHISMLAASIVGVAGRVVAIEPNPDCCRRLRNHVQVNFLQNTLILDYALGSRDMCGALQVFDGHSGSGSLVATPDSGTTDTVNIRVRRGDECMAELDVSPDAIKIDVEGFEFEVIRGLERVLLLRSPLLIMEINLARLSDARCDTFNIAALMHNAGYVGWRMATKRRWGKHTLRLAPWAPTQSDGTVYNTVWLSDNNQRHDTWLKSQWFTH